MLATIDGKYDARLDITRSSADELWRSLCSCSPRSTSAPRVMVSAFECGIGTDFDAQLSLTVAYHTHNPSNDIKTQRDAQEALQRS